MRTGVHYLTLKIRRPMATERRERSYLSFSLSLSLFLSSNPRIRRFDFARATLRRDAHEQKNWKKFTKHSIRYDITRDILGRNFPFSSSFFLFSLPHSLSLFLSPPSPSPSPLFLSLLLVRFFLSFFLSRLLIFLSFFQKSVDYSRFFFFFFSFLLFFFSNEQNSGVREGWNEGISDGDHFAETRTPRDEIMIRD